MFIAALLHVWKSCHKPNIAGGAFLFCGAHTVSQREKKDIPHSVKYQLCWAIRWCTYMTGSALCLAGCCCLENLCIFAYFPWKRPYRVESFSLLCLATASPHPTESQVQETLETSRGCIKSFCRGKWTLHKLYACPCVRRSSSNECEETSGCHLRCAWAIQIKERAPEIEIGETHAEDLELPLPSPQHLSRKHSYYST